MAIDLVSVMIAVALAIYSWQAFGTPAGAGFLKRAADPALHNSTASCWFAFYFCVFILHGISVCLDSRESGVPAPRVVTGPLLPRKLGAGAAAYWWCASFMMVESALLRVVLSGSLLLQYRICYWLTAFLRQSGQFPAR